MTRDGNDVIHRKRAQRILGDLKKSVVEFCLERRRLIFACSLWPSVGCCTWFGADGKDSIERMCITLLMSKNLFNPHVIKCFVPELRSRNCFSCFGIPILYIYIYIYIYIYMIYEHYMYVSHILSYIYIYTFPILSVLQGYTKCFVVSLYFISLSIFQKSNLQLFMEMKE